MIANRFRLEKQILFGRQAVRKSMQTKIRTNSPDSRLAPQAQELTTSSIYSPTSVPFVQSGSDLPLSVDTDAETAFANGSHWFFKQGRVTPSSASGVSTPRETPPNPQLLRIRTNVIRRKLAPVGDNAQEQVSDQPAGPPLAGSSKRTPPPSSDGFFVRLRSQSFPSIKSSLSSFSKVKDAAAEEIWSSESSSEGDLGPPTGRSLIPSLTVSPDYTRETAENDDELGDF
jgi:hypothetical protein